MVNELKKYLWIRLHFHIKAISVNTKHYLCSHPDGSNSVVAEKRVVMNTTKIWKWDTLSNKDMHKLGKHAQWQNALKNRRSPIAQRMKKACKQKIEQ